MPKPMVFITQQNRSQLLKAVQREVTQQLQSGLHKAVLSNLVDEHPSPQVQRLWDVQVKIGKRPIYQLPQNTSIITVFDDTGGKFLILGALGAGKTTTLLELATELINRAEHSTQPIPVIFNFSSWQDDNQTLADWLVAQLKFKYGIPINMGRQWINQRQLLPLLDGLDELQLPRQQRCLEAIQQLLAGDNPPQYLVVCTGLEDYKSCQTKLQLHGAVYLRPLTDAQIRDYLLSAKSRELWHNINADAAILALARTPLLLNMMAVADEEILIHSWKRLDSQKERYLYLLNAYIRRTLTWEINHQWYRRGEEPRPEKTKHWLIWLAKKMKQENQAEFLIESLEPTWWQNPHKNRRYRLVVGLIFGIIGALFAGVLGGAIGGLIGVLMPSIARFRHFTELIILCWNGYIPWKYARFLNYATSRLLLQKVGKRYQFIHYLLRQHFARMPLT